MVRTSVLSLLLAVALAALFPGLWALLDADEGTGVARAADDGFDANLLRNPGFEEGFAQPSFWTAVNADLAARDARVAFEGSVSGLLFSAAGEKEMAWQQHDVPLLAGARYVLSGRVRADGPAVAMLGVRWEAGGQRQEQRLHRGISSDGLWQRVELEFVSTVTGPASVVVGGVADGSVWWDDVALRRVDDRPQQLAAQWEALLDRYGEVYTGLIVDARGLGLQRGMSPKIVDEDGNIVYAGMDADASVVIGRGLVSYMYDPNDALKHSRVTVNEHFPYSAPLIVSATGLVDEPTKTGVVISVADAARIRRELEKYDFFGRYAVVFILGDRT